MATPKTRAKRRSSRLREADGAQPAGGTEIVRESVDRLGHALARPTGDFNVPPPANYIFWLGAGFSKTAGIPLAEGVVDRLLDKRWQPTTPESGKLEKFCRLTPDQQVDRQNLVREWAMKEKLLGGDPITDWGSTYGECLRLLPGEVDRQEFIIECIEEGRGRLNMAHLLLGQLIKSRFVETVITTNFDDLLLRALQLYFVVPSTLDPDSTSTLLTNSRFVQVAYLHGRLASYRQRHTPTEVQDSIQGFENYLAQALQDHGLVVIGYRGGDETPLHLLHKVLMTRGTGPGRGLFWVTFSEDSAALPRKVVELLKLKDCYWLPGWDADAFMKKLCAWPGIGLGIPDPSDWTKGMEEMLPPEARVMLSAAQHRPLPEPELRLPAELPGDVLSTTQPAWLSKAKSLARTQPEDALKMLVEAKPESEQSLEALKLWVKTLDELDRKGEALALAKAAAELFPGDSEAAEMLATAYYKNKNYDSSVAAYQRALELGGEEFWLKRCMGVSLNFGNRLDEAEATLRGALAAATKPWEQAQAFTWLAETLNRLGRHAEAIGNLEQAAKLQPLHYSDYRVWAESLNALGRTDEATEKLKLYDELKERKQGPKRLRHSGSQRQMKDRGLS